MPVSCERRDAATSLLHVLGGRRPLGVNPWGSSGGAWRAAIHPAEDHSAGRRLQDAGHGYYHFLAYRGASLLDHHHGAVFEVADSLTDLVARLDDANVHVLARQRHRLEGVGQLIQVDDLDSLQLGDLV